MRFFFLFICIILSDKSIGQIGEQPRILRISSAYTAFPDSARAKGHTYENTLYTASTHYSDSSILIVVPPHFKPSTNPDIVCWFHGWRNTIDSAATYFELITQFIASQKNAIFILPETGKNTPDSYGGKLEQQGTFRLLLLDVMKALEQNNLIAKKSKPGKVMLAGHSGAFRVMAFILQNGDIDVNKVILFDGLYSQIDKYTNWIQADTSHQFINLYTNKGGGTDEVSEKMMLQLQQKKLAFVHIEESNLQADIIKAHQVIFVHSLKEHNDVINKPDHNFRLILENSFAVNSSY